MNDVPEDIAIDSLSRRFAHSRSFSAKSFREPLLEEDVPMLQTTDRPIVNYKQKYPFMRFEDKEIENAFITYYFGDKL
jgi:hypothetical protein